MLLRLGRLPKSKTVSGLALALGLAASASRLAAQEGWSACREYPLNVPPVGSAVNRFMAVQAANAGPAKFVFYPSEWYMGGCELGPMGCRHLLAVAQAAPGISCPIVVEPCGDPSLDEARRVCVVKGLALQGLPDADKRVVLKFPATIALRGEQAEITYQSWLASGRNDWNHGFYGGFGTGNYLGGFGYGQGQWGQGYWGMGIGGSYGYPGLLSMPYRN
jgi:hypothetical protein